MILAAKLTIHADLSRVTFRHGDREFSGEPVVYADPNAPPDKWGYGEAGAVAGGTRMELFAERPGSQVPAGVLLGAFLAHGAAQVRGRFTLRRPSVHVAVSDALTDFLRGYAGAVFAEAVRSGLQATEFTIQTYADSEAG